MAVGPALVSGYDRCDIFNDMKVTKVTRSKDGKTGNVEDREKNMKSERKIFAVSDENLIR